MKNSLKILFFSFGPKFELGPYSEITQNTDR